MVEMADTARAANIGINLDNLRDFLNLLDPDRGDNELVSPSG
jgi:hypothetical protein